MRAFYPSVAVGRLVDRYAVHHRGWMEIDESLYFLPFHSACILSISSRNLISSFEISFGKMDCVGKKITPMFSDVPQIQLICLIYSLIRRVFEIQRAFVMMQDSGRSLPVFAGVLKCIFTCELQSESSTNVFLFSFHAFFCTVGFNLFRSTNL